VATVCWPLATRTFRVSERVGTVAATVQWSADTRESTRSENRERRRRNDRERDRTENMEAFSLMSGGALACEGRCDEKA
jgi:hypothetical protein